ncbi:MAG: FapA family protein [Vallitaleaceae bacterium]|nr:FapA family protein [Vallitaleaceae bacterium]
MKITEFVSLKEAITTAQLKITLIGDLKPVLEISVSGDRLKAYVIINMSDDEFNKTDKKVILEKIVIMSNQNQIEYGFNLNELIKSIKPNEKIIVAEGLLPVRGEDAVVIYYEIKDLQPEIFQDGKVNHYELNLINKVNRGEWVGERIEPTYGIPGKTVYGEVIPAQPGRTESLKYDKKSIEEVVDAEGKKTLLFSKQIGAVVYENGIVSVCNYLEIKGRVSFETGNIDFDGFVEVKDSVEDNFSIIADNDIQVMGQMGVGGVDTIESKDGSIYIRGGIAGKNKAKIICNGDLYTKFASDCTIECKGTVNIGYYAMNCNITAKEVVLESYNSKIIGGTIDAQIRVLAGEIGSRADIYTKINVSGFVREDMKAQYDQINVLIEKSKDRTNFLKQQLAVYDVHNMDAKQLEAYHLIEDDYQKNKKNLQLFYVQKKKYISYLHTKGEGEITATKYMHSNVHLKIKSEAEHIVEEEKLAVSFYYLDGEMHKD